MIFKSRKNIKNMEDLCSKILLGPEVISIYLTVKHTC